MVTNLAFQQRKLAVSACKKKVCLNKEREIWHFLFYAKMSSPFPERCCFLDFMCPFHCQWVLPRKKERKRPEMMHLEVKRNRVPPK